MRTLLFACSLIAAPLFAPANVFAQAYAPEAAVANSLEMFQDAVTAFREHRYSAAYGRFMRLADAGHEASAQMALMMYRNGPAMFDAEWEATDQQLAHWSDIVVASERESAEHTRVSLR